MKQKDFFEGPDEKNKIKSLLMTMMKNESLWLLSSEGRTWKLATRGSHAASLGEVS